MISIKSIKIFEKIETLNNLEKLFILEYLGISRHNITANLEYIITI